MVLPENERLNLSPSFSKQISQVEKPADNKNWPQINIEAKCHGLLRLGQVHEPQEEHYQCKEQVQNSGKAFRPGNEIEFKRSVSQPNPFFRGLDFPEGLNKNSTNGIGKDEYGHRTEEISILLDIIHRITRTVESVSNLTDHIGI